MINMREYLEEYLRNSEINLTPDRIFLPDIELEPENIKVVMINEVVPENPEDDFYSTARNPAYMETTTALFEAAGHKTDGAKALLEKGIYLTNAVKFPKSEYTIPRQTILEHAAVIEAELDLFSRLKVIMLMGDVAIKSVNSIAKKNTKKNAIPTGSTYKLRSQEFYMNDIRLFPSYIMTGKNLLIEKSKFTMASEDIHQMLALI